MTVIPGDTYAERAIAGTLRAREDSTVSRVAGTDRVQLEGGVMTVAGHSETAVGGLRGNQGSYPLRLARRLGITGIQDLGVGGSIACWNNSTYSSFGGWGFLIGGENVHGVAAGYHGTGAPYLPSRHIGIVHMTQNDLGELGVTKPLPMQIALRSLISWMCTASFIDDTDAAFTYTGAGWTAQALGGIGTGVGSTYHTTAAVTDYMTLTLPADYPGTPHAVTITTIVNPAHDFTLGVKVDGVDRADLRITGANVCDTNVASKFNLYPIRFTDLTPGAHTIRLTLKTQHVAASTFLPTDARIESNPAEGPIVIVPSCLKTVDSDYSLWSTWPGYATLNDAAVETWKTAERSVVNEFGNNVLYVDIDTPLNQNPKNFVADKTHFSGLGASIVADTIYDKMISSGVITEDRITRPTQIPTVAFTRVFGMASAPSALANSWAMPATGTPLAIYRDLNGRLFMQGAIGGGTSATATITTFPPEYRPLKDMDFVGVSSGGAIQRWRITSTGVLSITSGGDTTKSTVHPVSWTPALA